MNAPAKKVTVGLIQMFCGASPEENLKNALRRIRRIAKKGAQIAVLPELFRSEYFCQGRRRAFFDLAEPVPSGPTTRALMAAAKSEKITLVTSVYERDPRGRFFNTAVVIDERGKLAGKYRKIHIPDDPANHYDEAYYFDRGDLGFQAVTTSRAVIGPMVCFDQWFPEGARSSAAKGAQILLYPTAIGWPVGQKRLLNAAEHDAWQVIQRSHAIANTVFVAVCNRVGPEHQLKFWGTSFVCDPYGRVLTKGSAQKEEDVIAVCDISLIEKMRRDWPFLKVYASHAR